MFRIMEVTLYSADEKSVFVDSKAISCREESGGSDIENKWVLILWTPSGCSYQGIYTGLWLRGLFIVVAFSM